MPSYTSINFVPLLWSDKVFPAHKYKEYKEKRQLNNMCYCPRLIAVLQIIWSKWLHVTVAAIWIWAFYKPAGLLLLLISAPRWICKNSIHSLLQLAGFCMCASQKIWSGFSRSVILSTVTQKECVCWKTAAKLSKQIGIRHMSTFRWEPFSVMV